MTISNKIKMAAAAGAIAGAAALFAPIGMAQAQPQGVIGAEAVSLVNPTAEELALFGEFGNVRDNGGGQFTVTLPGADEAGNGSGATTWYDIISAFAERFAAIGVETGNETPPYGGVSA
ncbi:hypothetical protein JRC04_16130 [Mycolicibacterium sp. S2-37]|uniref:hypothetical protein n=1 Tax=Mycolicibacterium sp. S2-37 TaxID=2810297 RepID=UPI001A9491B7|nr:hypothetical protein [Mycolicibacterium sp. S2-37]MBO0678996.1 hypothetical protein [Mycolicibacterium sp. S2-37]